MLKYKTRSSKTFRSPGWGDNHTQMSPFCYKTHSTQHRAAQGSQGSVTQQIQEAIGTGSVLKIWFGMQSARWPALKFPSISFYPRKYNNIDS